MSLALATRGYICVRGDGAPLPDIVIGPGPDIVGAEELSPVVDRGRELSPRIERGEVFEDGGGED